ncbi:MAG: DMT family transporter [Thermodesulfobacteriota bacterium]|nr:DMT family transporter [Thermodesulfobacteriota bacterium]
MIPKIRVRKMFILTITGQVLMAMAVSHFGMLGTPRDLISIKKIIGAVLIVIGVMFSTI